MSEFRDFYTEGYSLPDRDEAERMGRWRALGARSKADHIATLLARAGMRPGSLVEIGCGDGALLAELSGRGVAPVLDGFELSPPAAELARARGVARTVEVFDGLDVPAEDGAYDLAVLSHVLEHVPEPMLLLREAARVAPAVLIEVPLEDNRSARRDEKREEAARIGHVQFFDRAAVHALVRVAGLTVTAELSDPLPYAHHAFFAETRGERATAAVKAGVRRAAWRVAAPRRGAAVHRALRMPGMSVTVRELGPGETHLAARTLLELRPALGSPEALVQHIDERLRPTGYRLIGAFEDGAEEAAAVAGFRINEFLAWGSTSTSTTSSPPRATAAVASPTACSPGWRTRRAAAACTQFHLDSGVGEDRQDAHRFYFRHGLRITSYHFHREL